MTSTVNAINATAAREYAKIAGIAAGAVIAASIPLAAAGALIASALGYDAALVGGSIISAAIVLAALIAFDALRTARALIVEQIAAHLARHSAEAKRINAEAEKLLAEADRIDAESQAIKTDAPAIFQTVSAGAGAKVKANITAPRVVVRGKSVSWNQVNQISQPDAEPKRLEFPREDWLWMLDQFLKVKHSKRLFVTERAPFSQQPAYPELYNELIRILVEGEAIKGRAPKSAGHLVITDINQLARLVEAEHPKGMIIDASPTPPLLESGK